MAATTHSDHAPSEKAMRGLCPIGLGVSFSSREPNPKSSASVRKHRVFSQGRSTTTHTHFGARIVDNTYTARILVTSEPSKRSGPDPGPVRIRDLPSHKATKAAAAPRTCSSAAKAPPTYSSTTWSTRR
eukprot:6179227-Pleurochrysis_carterae.AAC.2